MEREEVSVGFYSEREREKETMTISSYPHRQTQNQEKERVEMRSSNAILSFWSAAGFLKKGDTTKQTTTSPR